MKVFASPVSLKSKVNFLRTQYFSDILTIDLATADKKEEVVHVLKCSFCTSRPSHYCVQANRVN